MDLQYKIKKGLHKLNKLKLKASKPVKVTDSETNKTLTQTNKELLARVDALQSELNTITNSVLMLLDNGYADSMQLELLANYKAEAYTLAAYSTEPDMQDTILDFLSSVAESFGEETEQEFFDIIYGVDNE